MTPAFEGGGKEGVDRVESHLLPSEPLTEAKDVGVVVQPRHSGRGDVVSGGRTNAGDLVGGDADSDATTAEGDAKGPLAADDGSADRGAEVGVVDRIGGVRTDVDDLVAGLFQVDGDDLLESEACMIGTEHDAHEVAKAI